MSSIFRKPGLRGIAVLVGTLVLLAAGCSNPAMNPPSGETGISLSVGIEGVESLTPANQQNSADPAARTVVPAFSPDPFSKYEALFTATSGGQTHGPVVISAAGTTSLVSLAAGTYTVTVTAYTGSDPDFTASAEGGVTGIVVSQGNTTPASVLLGPKAGEDPGTFRYDITVPAGAGGTLTVTGTAVSDGTITLPANQQTSGTMSLDPGYYRVEVSLTRGGEYAGLIEVLHIYRDLESALTRVYTEANFGKRIVYETDLSGRFAAPVVGETAETTFDATQYQGAITWSPAIIGGVFAENTLYTATVTLTAKSDYTFDGLGANVFSYSGALSVTNSADSGDVTIDFQATGQIVGQGSLGLGFDTGVIPVTAAPASRIIEKGGASLTLSIPAEYTVTDWSVDGQVIGGETGNTVTLDPGDYNVKTHSVSVSAAKGGRPYSQTLDFTVLPGTPVTNTLTITGLPSSFYNGADIIVGLLDVASVTTYEDLDGTDILGTGSVLSGSVEVSLFDDSEPWGGSGSYFVAFSWNTDPTFLDVYCSKAKVMVSGDTVLAYTTGSFKQLPYAGEFELPFGTSEMTLNELLVDEDFSGYDDFKAVYKSYVDTMAYDEYGITVSTDYTLYRNPDFTGPFTGTDTISEGMKFYTKFSLETEGHHDDNHPERGEQIGTISGTVSFTNMSGNIDKIEISAYQGVETSPNQNGAWSSYSGNVKQNGSFTIPLYENDPDHRPELDPANPVYFRLQVKYTDDTRYYTYIIGGAGIPGISHDGTNDVGFIGTADLAHLVISGSVTITMSEGTIRNGWIQSGPPGGPPHPYEGRVRSSGAWVMRVPPTAVGETLHFNVYVQTYEDNFYYKNLMISETVNPGGNTGIDLGTVALTEADRH